MRGCKNKKQTLVIPVVRIFLEKNFVLRREFVYGVSDYLIIQKTKIMASGPIIAWQIDVETVTDFILGGSKITADDDCSHEIKRGLLKLWKKSHDQPRQHIKKLRHYFADKGLSSQSYGFSSSHVWM